MMLVRTAKKSIPPIDVKSVSFDHTGIQRYSLGMPKPTKVIEFTLEMVPSVTTRALFKPKAKVLKIDLLLTSLGKDRSSAFRSQVEIGNSVVSDYTLSPDKKKVTVKLSSPLVNVVERKPTKNEDWNLSG
jgi:hypothetical protein